LLTVLWGEEAAISGTAGSFLILELGASLKSLLEVSKAWPLSLDCFAVAVDFALVVAGFLDTFVVNSAHFTFDW